MVWRLNPSFINKGIEIYARSHPLDKLQIWATCSYLHTSLNNLTGKVYYLHSFTENLKFEL